MQKRDKPLRCLLNNGDGGNTETSQSLLGPFWRLNSPRTQNGGSIVRSATAGPPLFVHGRVVDRAGHPIAGAEVDVWHCSEEGLYENQDETVQKVGVVRPLAETAGGSRARP